MYSQFAHIASDEAINDPGVNLEKIDTEGRIILAKQESSLNRLKIAFSAYYSQQKVNKRETDEKPSVYEHYEQNQHASYIRPIKNNFVRMKFAGYIKSGRICLKQ